jgi:hypothetical protein
MSQLFKNHYHLLSHMAKEFIAMATNAFHRNHKCSCRKCILIKNRNNRILSNKTWRERRNAETFPARELVACMQLLCISRTPQEQQFFGLVVASMAKCQEFTTKETYTMRCARPHLVVNGGEKQRKKGNRMPKIKIACTQPIAS